MRTLSAPLRFPMLVIGAWMCGRIALALPGLWTSSSFASAALAGMRAMPLAIQPKDGSALPEPASDVTVMLDAAPATLSRQGGIAVALDVPRWRLASVDLAPPPPPPTVAPPAPRPEISVLSGRERGERRWSGYGWIFARERSGGSGLASGGQLGGSQAGVRLAYRIAELGTGSLALAGGVSMPLRHSEGAEAALGIDWKPAAKLPLRLAIERRIAIGREGRNAWSANVAGGFYRGGLPGGAELDVYAQAGVVGAHSRDLFADGALRIGRPIALPAGKKLVLGAGAWGAAQPGVARLDIVPRAELRMAVGGTAVTGAAEWRIKVAGDARPGSGVAFSLAAGF